MDQDKLQQIINWVNRGTLQQFKIEVDARLTGTNYESEIDKSTLTFYEVRKEGGFLGIGGKTVREPVFQLTADEDMVEVDESMADAEFVETLTHSLSEH